MESFSSSSSQNDHLFSFNTQFLPFYNSDSLFDITPKEEENDDPFSPFHRQCNIFNYNSEYPLLPLQDCLFQDVIYPALDHMILPSLQDDFTSECNSYFEGSSDEIWTGCNVDSYRRELTTWSADNNTEDSVVKHVANNSTDKLSFDEISEYFYHPITHAAKELNVGLTLLKKRCRELGIKRWPHRKLTSMLTLINNVQEMVNDMRDGDVTNAVDTLHKERVLMEMNPDAQLLEKTKKLRQACFKANYKKKKQISFR